MQINSSYEKNSGAKSIVKLSKSDFIIVFYPSLLFFLFFLFLNLILNIKYHNLIILLLKYFEKKSTKLIVFSKFIINLPFFQAVF